MKPFLSATESEGLYVPAVLLSLWIPLLFFRSLLLEVRIGRGTVYLGLFAHAHSLSTEPSPLVACGAEASSLGSRAVCALVFMTRATSSLPPVGLLVTPLLSCLVGYNKHTAF